MIFHLEKIGGNAKIRKIAVTGTLSAGKSTACETLYQLGAYVLKADDIVHDLLSHNVDIIQKIKEMFNSDVIVQGKIDRKKLADSVFNHPEKLQALEEVLHPKVVETIQKTYTDIKDSRDYKAFVVEFPLLFEINFNEWFDEIVYITANSALRKKRFLAKGFDESQFLAREKRFIPESEKLSKSNIIIENNGSIENLNHHLSKIL